jgi:transcriptional regulator with XRE-family HTH domain
MITDTKPLRAIRKELGLTTTQVAAMCGISQQAVEKWERLQGTGIGMENIMKAAEAYGFKSADDFLRHMEALRAQDE